MTFLTLRARAQLLQMVPIPEGSPCKQHQAKIPSQFRRGCGWGREATSVRPPKPTQLEGESAIATRRSTTVATMEDPPNSPQPSLLQDLQYESIIAEEYGGPVGQPVARNPGGHDFESDSTESMLPRISGDVFTRRALVMRSVPRVLPGPYTAAVRLSLQEASQAQQDGDQVRLSRAWSLFLLYCCSGDLQEAAWFQNGIWKVD